MTGGAYAARAATLDNGLRVLLAPRRAAPVVSVWTAFDVGSGAETPGDTGLAHFLEHMMFKGTARFGKGEVDRITQRHGGTNNAYTTCDHTCYYFDFPKAHLDAALELEADRMRGLALDADEVAAERTVILEEIGRARDLPDQRLVEEADRLLFGDHGYGHSILGVPEDVAAFTPERLRAFYDRWYHPDNAVLVVAGDFDADACLDRVRARFGDLPRGPARPAAPAPPITPREAQRFAEREELAVPRFFLQFLGIRAGDPREPAVELLAHLLAPNPASRLHTALVHTGLLASVRAENDARRDPGVFWIAGEAPAGTAPEAVEEALFAELARVAREGPTAAELARGQRALVAAHVYQAELMADLAEEMCDAALTDGPEALATWAARVGAATAADVARAGAEVCARERSVMAWSVPA